MTTNLASFLGQFIGVWAMFAIVYLLGRFFKKLSVPRSRRGWH